MSTLTENTALVAFGGYRCHCTMVAAALDEVPDLCPTHHASLLGAPSWESNPNNVQMGLEGGK